MLFLFSTLWQLKATVFLHWCFICAVLLLSSHSTVVEQSPHCYKVEGSLPATTSDSGRERMVKKVTSYTLKIFRGLGLD